MSAGWNVMLWSSSTLARRCAAPIPISFGELGSFHNLWDGIKTHIRSYFGLGTSYKSAKARPGQLDGENTWLLDGQNTEQLDAQKAHLGPLEQGGGYRDIQELSEKDFSESVDFVDSELRKMALDITEKKNDEAQIALKTYEDALPAMFEHVFNAQLKLIKEEDELHDSTDKFVFKVEKLIPGNTKLNELFRTLRKSFTNAHLDPDKKVELLENLYKYQFKIRNGHFPEKAIVDVLSGIYYFHPSPKALHNE
ncbi:hypothetical protein ACQY0O_004615 [Thecaphora frezii]